MSIDCSIYSRFYSINNSCCRNCFLFWSGISWFRKCCTFFGTIFVTQQLSTQNILFLCLISLLFFSCIKLVTRRPTDGSLSRRFTYIIQLQCIHAHLHVLTTHMLWCKTKNKFNTKERKTMLYTVRYATHPTKCVTK